MNKLSLNEIAALEMVLHYVSLKDLFSSAMNHLSMCQDTRDKDNANILFLAIDSFLL